jgi:hypothetical protein
MIRPVQQDDAFLADVAATRGEADGFRLWWLGQSGFLVQWRGRHLLLDPYLSDSLTKKYAATDKPHVRMTERVVDPARLGFVDVVTSSHNHTDHLDAETLGPLLHANPDLVLVVPEANRAFVAERLGIDPAGPVGLDDGAEVDAGGFRIAGVPAAHEEFERDERGRGRSRSITRATVCPTRGRPTGSARLRSTSPSCRSTAARLSGACPATSRGPKRPGSLGTSAPASSSRATTRCSSSTPPRRTPSWPRHRGSASRSR